MEYKIREKLFGANKASASGTSLTLNNTVKYPINKLTIDGVCEQNTTTGKNLVYISSKYNSNYSSTLDGDAVIINGTSEKAGNVTMNLNGNGFTMKANETYTVSVYIDGTVTGGSYKVIYLQGMAIGNFGSNKIVRKTMALTEDKLCKLLNFDISANCVFTNMKVRVQIEKGDIGTDYEPYTGGQPSPSPDYPQEIKTIENRLKITSCNKNILDINNLNFKNGYYDSSGIWHADVDSNGNFEFIEVLSNTTITVSINQIVRIIAISEFDSSKNFIIRTFASNIQTKTIKTNASTKYIALTFNLDNTTLVTKQLVKSWQPQLELGPAATDYEQHLETQIEANLPEGEFVGKLDETYKDTLNVVYKDDGHYHLILKKMIGKVVLNGSEGNIYAFYENPGDYNQINATLGITNIDTTNKYDFRCNYFGYYEKATGNKTRSGMVKYGTNPNFVFSVPKTIITATSTWINWISTHNVIIYYPFATSYEVDLGIVDTLLSYDEITNIFTDSDLYPVINVKYYNGSLDISNYEFSIKEV